MLFATGLDQLRAAGEATRLRTLALLRDGDLTVSELTRCLEQSQPRVSRHLRVLVDAGLIEPYQEGSWRFYRLGELPGWLDGLLAGLEGPEREADRAAHDEVRQERAAQAAAYFARNAPEWDALRQLHIDDTEIERAMLDLAPPEAGTLIDLGTGTGRMLVLFRDRYREALGFDASPEMLAVARVRLEEAGVRHASVRRRDILAAGELPVGAADLVSVHHVLHFLGEPERAIAHAGRALRPGGCVLIADFAPHALEELRERHAHRRLGFSTEEIRGFAERAGLVLKAEETLHPGPEGNLVSKIWRLDKPLTAARKEKARA